jgi:hypothetical protein
MVSLLGERVTQGWHYVSSVMENRDGELLTFGSVMCRVYRGRDVDIGALIKRGRCALIKRERCALIKREGVL